ncbi:MAG: 50S ribosomal protein L22 [Chloroflexota bacterium]|nr:MAG: 50S ribosomal protein L22 [Chloroflexota bacterium]
MAGEDIRAHAQSIPISAQKVRLLVNLVRGKGVVDALNMLKFMPQGAARPVSKVVASAMANAEENFGVSRDDLYIHTIFADEAPTRKWRRFGARGRFKPWLRRAAHVTVILREREQ